MSNYTAAVSFFSQQCQTQLNQPLSRLDAANDGLGATLAVMYAVSAAVSAFFFATWKRADDDLKSRVWRRYGWFCALAFWGSCAGLVTAVGDNQYRYIFNRIVVFLIREDTCNKIKQKDYPDTEDGVIEWIKAVVVCYQGKASELSLWMNRLSVSPVPYAIEFLCICCVNLLVVERMVDFVGKGQQLGGRWLKLSARVAIVSVTVLNATNLAFMAVNAHFCVQGSSYLNQLIAKTQNLLQNPNPQELGDAISPCLDDMSSPKCFPTFFINSASDAISQGLTFAGYGSICEGCSLFIMLVSFVVAGALCIRRFHSGATNNSTEAGRRNNKVRRQIIGTVSTVFLTFLIRAVYAAALAASRQGGNVISTTFSLNKDAYRSKCDNTKTIDVSDVCRPCQGMGPLVQMWLYLCPAFSFTVFLLSSPVTILVALWGMTTDSLLLSLGGKWAGFRFGKKATLGDGLKSFIKAGGEA